MLQRVQLGPEEHAAGHHGVPLFQSHHVHLHALPGTTWKTALCLFMLEDLGYLSRVTPIGPEVVQIATNHFVAATEQLV